MIKPMKSTGMIMKDQNRHTGHIAIQNLCPTHGVHNLPNHTNTDTNTDANTKTDQPQGTQLKKLTKAS
jgi:hypothetical protein